LKKAFTLIEIVITVLIISIIGFALLQMKSNTIKSLELLDTRLKVNKYSSFIFSNITKDLHEKQKSVYEFIQDRYNIRDDELIEYLKNKEYRYTQDELFFLNFGENEEGDSEIMQEDRNQNRDEVTDEIKKQGILIERISIKDEINNSTSIYHFSYLK